MDAPEVFQDLSILNETLPALLESGANIERLLIFQNTILGFVTALLFVIIFAIVWGRH